MVWSYCYSHLNPYALSAMGRTYKQIVSHAPLSLLERIYISTEPQEKATDGSFVVLL